NQQPTTGRFDQLTKGLERDEYRAVLSQMTHTIYGLNWTSDSSEFVFGVQSSGKPGDSGISETSIDGTHLADTAGNYKRVAYQRSSLPVRSPLAGMLSRDRRYLVSHAFELAYSTHRPLIWDTG